MRTKILNQFIFFLSITFPSEQFQSRLQIDSETNILAIFKPIFTILLHGLIFVSSPLIFKLLINNFFTRLLVYQFDHRFRELVKFFSYTKYKLQFSCLISIKSGVWFHCPVVKLS